MQTRRLLAPGALQQAYTAQAGAGLVTIEMKSGKITHQSPSFQDLTSWIPVEARGNIRVALESSDGDDFHSFCQSVVKDAGEPCGETFLDRDKVLGRSFTVRFFTRAPGPPGLRNPEWLLLIRAVKLTLVGMQPRQLAGELPPAGGRRPFFWQKTITEAIGVFTADLSGGTPQQWTVQAAHVRNLLDMEVAPGTYDMDVGNVQPLAQISMLFDLGFSKEGVGGGASVLSRAATTLEYAATSALNFAQRSASWLTRKALKIEHQWSIRLDDDDTVSASFLVLIRLCGGLSTTVSVDFIGGKVGLSHGGLDFLYFVADPAQPLDGNLRAALFRITSTKTFGASDVHRHFVTSCTWGSGNFHFLCTKLSLDSVGGEKPSEENMSELFEKLKVSPGAGHLSDGSASICLGQSP